jgi:hypothetical protein
MSLYENDMTYDELREKIKDLGCELASYQHALTDAIKCVESYRAQSDNAVEALKEIREVWAGAEVGVPHYAQEAYAINLCKQMYSIAVNSMKECGK